MGRRNESPEKKRRRALIGEFLKENSIKDANDINELVKELIAQVVENSLEGELDDELGYTKYDYRNKDTDNSRNGYSKKTVHSSFGDSVFPTDDSLLKIFIFSSNSFIFSPVFIL